MKQVYVVFNLLDDGTQHEWGHRGDIARIFESEDRAINFIRETSKVILDNVNREQFNDDFIYDVPSYEEIKRKGGVDYYHNSDVIMSCKYSKFEVF